MAETQYLRLSQLARKTGLPAAWLKREADAGRLPCIRAGRVRMFDPGAVREVLSERAREEAGSEKGVAHAR